MDCFLYWKFDDGAGQVTKDYTANGLWFDYRRWTYVGTGFFAGKLIL